MAFNDLSNSPSISTSSPTTLKRERVSDTQDDLLLPSKLKAKRRFRMSLVPSSFRPSVGYPTDDYILSQLLPSLLLLQVPRQVVLHPSLSETLASTPTMPLLLPSPPPSQLHHHRHVLNRLRSLASPLPITSSPRLPPKTTTTTPPHSRS